MDSLLENKRKVFKPLILFHDQETIDTPARNRRLSLIEEHKIKTKDMLDYNALLWEDEGRPYCSTPKPCSSDQSPSIRNQQLTPCNRSSDIIPSSNELIFNNQGQANNSFFSTSHSSSPAMDTLEPRTQTSIPLPLYNNNQQETVFQAEEFELVDTNTTTFIAEPQFHHTYRPNISRKRRRGNLPKEVTEFLKRWLILHKKHPYPTEREKQKLADETGLMVNQISNWFINARRRILQPLLESELQMLPKNNIPSGSNDSPSFISRSRSTSNGTIIDHSTEKQDSHYETSSAPPPWVLLPNKLPSMNILEKDLDAFKPE